MKTVTVYGRKPYFKNLGTDEAPQNARQPYEILITNPDDPRDGGLFVSWELVDKRDYPAMGGGIQVQVITEPSTKDGKTKDFVVSLEFMNGATPYHKTYQTPKGL